MVRLALLKLLIGFLFPIEGEILIDGEPLKKIGPQVYRSNLGVVMQDDQLLAGSIADNISFLDPELDMDRIIKAEKLACLHEDIQATPMGYYGLVGDMGSSLSGGKSNVL